MAHSIEEARRLVEQASPWRPAPDWAARLVTTEPGETGDVAGVGLVDAFVEVGVGQQDAVRLAEGFAAGQFASFADALKYRSPWAQARSGLDSRKVAEVAGRLEGASSERTPGRLLEKIYPDSGPGLWRVNVMAVDEVAQVVRFQARVTEHGGCAVYEQLYEHGAGGEVALHGDRRGLSC